MHPGVTFLSHSWLSALLFTLVAVLPTTRLEAAYLINAQQGNYQTEPKFIRDRFAYLESLPFDGMTISTGTGRNLMNGVPRSFAQMSLDFGPLTGLVFKRLKHNFALVNVQRPADFFDDWSVTIENFRRLARVLRMRGIDGVFFDNEEYDGGVFNYPEDCSYPSRSLAEYQDQARLRGRQIAAAMSREHPTLVFVALHGPYSSFSGTPDDVRAGQTVWDIEELRGPFSVGVMEGLGKRATFVDGGEAYVYRSEAEFDESYAFRKEGIASSDADCPFIPEDLRPLWPSKLSVAFGVYNLPFNGVSMDPPILRTTLERALRRADKYVWLYSESVNWNAPGEISTDLVDAVAGARAAAGPDLPTTLPWVALTSPGDRSTSTKSAPLTLTASASSGDRRVTKVEFFRGATKLGESVDAPFSYVWENPPSGSHRITAKATDESGATSVSSPIRLTVTSVVASRISFQPAGVTPPVGFSTDSGHVFGARSNLLTYGWNVDHGAHARHRSVPNLDLHLATLMQIQSGGTWGLSVPNGRYSVTVGIGDSEDATSHTINVEHVSFWAATALSAGRFARKTRIVSVVDGKLTLDQGDAGSEATRINYVKVTGLRAAPPQ